MWVAGDKERAEEITWPLWLNSVFEEQDYHEIFITLG
jgi:hypothetical protein